MNKHKNRKFKRYGLHEQYSHNGKMHPAYVENEDGALIRTVAKTTKKWRKQNGVL